MLETAGKITTIEYRKAAKKRAQTREEIARRAAEAPEDGNRVRNMFMALGRAALNESKG